MKKLAWIQITLGGLITGLMGYVFYWSLTGLVAKLTGPAFANETDASRWVPLHPGFVSFARWYLPVVLALGIAVLIIGFIQVERRKGDNSWPITFQIVTGFVIAISALVVLLAIKPNQWLLSNGQGTMMLNMASTIWNDTVSVLIFITIILGAGVAGAGIAQSTLANRPDLPAAAGKPGWKRARSTTRRYR